jgi:hypothetical protein
MSRNKEDARAGWKARREGGRSRGRVHDDKRAEIRAARQALLHTEETGFNPEVQVSDPSPGEDYVSALSDADLVALYKQLHDNRAPAPKAKRATIERAVRARQAELAAAQGDPTEFEDDDGTL